MKYFLAGKIGVCGIGFLCHHNIMLFLLQLNFSDEHLHINIRYLLTEVASHRRTLPISTSVQICGEIVMLSFFSCSTASFVKRAVLSTTYGPGFHLITHGFMS